MLQNGLKQNPSLNITKTAQCQRLVPVATPFSFATPLTGHAYREELRRPSLGTRSQHSLSQVRSRVSGFFIRRACPLTRPHERRAAGGEVHATLCAIWGERAPELLGDVSAKPQALPRLVGCQWRCACAAVSCRAFRACTRVFIIPPSLSALPFSRIGVSISSPAALEAGGSGADGLVPMVSLELQGLTPAGGPVKEGLELSLPETRVRARAGSADARTPRMIDVSPPWQAELQFVA